MTIQLEATGGFTGKLGKQTMPVATDRLAAVDAAPITRDLEQIPADAWGQSYRSPQPKPWDFLYCLTIDNDRSIEYHLDQGPPALTTLAHQITDLQNKSAQ